MSLPAKQIGAKVASFNEWDGNWGFALEVPSALAQGKLKAGAGFKVKYEYTYSDIAESDIKRTMKCVLAK